MEISTCALSVLEWPPSLGVACLTAGRTRAADMLLVLSRKHILRPGEITHIVHTHRHCNKYKHVIYSRMFENTHVRAHTTVLKFNQKEYVDYFELV